MAVFIVLLFKKIKISVKGQFENDPHGHFFQNNVRNSILGKISENADKKRQQG